MVLVEGLILPTLVFGSTVSVSALQPVLASSDWLRAVPLFASIPLSCVKKINWQFCLLLLTGKRMTVLLV